MNEHMKSAVEAGKLALCKHYNEWEDGQILVWDSPSDIQEEINEFEDATRAALDAMLPHIRAMIAEENIALYEQAARIADEMVARIAEGNSRELD